MFLLLGGGTLSFHIQYMPKSARTRAQCPLPGRLAEPADAGDRRAGGEGLRAPGPQVELLRSRLGRQQRAAEWVAKMFFPPRG